jgi:NDP-sugar pyrophosphorylase family protein
MLKIQDVLILAAGRGNRMRPLTDQMPKAMAPFKGDTLIGNTLKNFKESEYRVHVTVGYKGGMLANYLLTHNVITSIHNTSGRDNAWWIFNSLLKNHDAPLLILTCDNVTDLDLDFIESEYSRLGQPTCMLVPVNPIVGIEGDYISDTDGVVDLLDRNTKTDKYCSGIQVLNPFKINELIASCENFYDVWQQLIKKGALKTSSIYPKSWFSIDSLDQLLYHENQP